MARGYFRNWEGHGSGFSTAPKKKKVKRCSYCGAWIPSEIFVAHIRLHTGTT